MTGPIDPALIEAGKATSSGMAWALDMPESVTSEVINQWADRVDQLVAALEAAEARDEAKGRGFKVDPETGNAVICLGYHEETNEWEWGDFVPAAKLAAAEALNSGLSQALGEAEARVEEEREWLNIAHREIALVRERAEQAEAKNTRLTMALGMIAQDGRFMGNQGVVAMQCIALDALAESRAALAQPEGEKGG